MKRIIAILLTLSCLSITTPQIHNITAAPKSTYKKILAAYKKNDYKKVKKLSKKLPTNAKEKCVKKMKSKYKKAAKKVIKKIGMFDYRSDKPGIKYYGYSDVDKDGKPELIMKYGMGEQDSTIRIYQYKGGKYKRVKGSADGWHTGIYNYTSGNGLVLKNGGQTDGNAVYESVRLVTIKKGRMKTKVIRERYIKDLNKRVNMPCAIKLYFPK